MVRCKVMLNLKREREKLFRMKKPNISAVKENSDEFVIRIQNKYSQLVDEMRLNDNLTNVLESALEDGGKHPKKTGEIFQQPQKTSSKKQVKW